MSNHENLTAALASLTNSEAAQFAAIVLASKGRYITIASYSYPRHIVIEAAIKQAQININRLPTNPADPSLATDFQLSADDIVISD